MPSRNVRPLALLAAASALFAACTGQPTDPSARVPAGGGRMEADEPVMAVDVLQRATPLEQAHSASAVIGKQGGTIAIPEAGFRIDFPSNAVRGQPVRITVTAAPGSDVAYFFEPHGLQFHNAPLVTQELRGTSVFQRPELRAHLEGAYFPEPADLAGGTAKVREIRPTQVDVQGWKLRFDLRHFSGYLVSAGRRGGYLGSSGSRARTDGPSL